MYPFSLPQNNVVLMGAVAQVGTAADVTSRAVSMKFIEKLYIIVNLNSAGGAAYAVTVQTDALVAFGSAATITTNVPIWYSNDADTDTQLTKATDATHYDTAADANPKLVVFEIDGSNMPSGENAVRVLIPALAVGDYASVTYIAIPRYAGESEVNLTTD